MRDMSELRQAMKDNATSSKDYFGLADDGDRATVVFLHASEEDIDWGKVYDVKLPIEGENKEIKKYILCKEDTDPLAATMKTKIRALFQLVVVDKDGKYGDVKVWDRGPNHIDQLLTFMETLGPLNTYPITIIRNGKKGQQSTKYQMIPGREVIDPVATELPKAENLTKTGRYILDLSIADMTKVANKEYYLPAFDKNDTNETVKAADSNTFGNQKPVVPNQQNTVGAPPKPVFNTATGKYEMPVAKPVTPPEPKLVDGQWVTPVLNSLTNEWEFPQETQKTAGVIGNKDNTSSSDVF